MKIAYINTTSSQGSTGKIVVDLKNLAKLNGYSTYIFYGVGNSMDSDSYKIQKKHNYYISNVLSRLFDVEGFVNFWCTYKLIRKLKRLKIDLIHIHNLHGHYINIKMLFNYIKKNNIKVVWTFHDCWPVTGHCAHFSYIKCNKWKTGCYDCVNKKEYPSTLLDNSRNNYKSKRDCFTGVKNLITVTPSKWLADILKESYLNCYNNVVINNGIDLDIFKQTDNDFLKKYEITDKIIILGISFDWSFKKGIDIFIELAHILGIQYQIVLVGTNDDIDKLLPINIISIHRTSNQNELAQIYSSADIFLNPTREDNYPSVNMEAIACGVPVITFNTGGSIEVVNEKVGYIVQNNTIDEIIDKLDYIAKNNSEYKKNCLEKRHEFDLNNRYCEYIKLYKNLLRR